MAYDISTDGATPPPGESTINKTPFICLSFVAFSICSSTSDGSIIGPDRLIFCRFTTCVKSFSFGIARVATITISKTVLKLF